MKYALVFSERKLFKTLREGTVEDIAALCRDCGYDMDEMTDQIDIFRNGRKIATYMAGA